MNDEAVCVRSADLGDYEALCALDSVAETDAGRRVQIRAWLESACCCVGEQQGQALAYGVLTRHFFGQPFIEMVMVGKAYRGHGRGAAILEYFKSAQAGQKLFSSTNLSNQPMQSLFLKQGFKPSGYIDNLDEGDPEIIFYHAPR